MGQNNPTSVTNNGFPTINRKLSISTHNHFIFRIDLYKQNSTTVKVDLPRSTETEGSSNCVCIHSGDNLISIVIFFSKTVTKSTQSEIRNSSIKSNIFLRKYVRMY